MQKMIKFLSLFVVLFASMTVSAEEKYAVIDVRAALFASKAAQSFSEQLKKDFSGDEEEIKKVGSEAQKLQDRMKKDGAMMSEAERGKISEEFEGKAKEFNFLKNKFEAAVNKRKQAFLMDSKPKVDQAILKVAKSNKLTMLFPKEATLWVEPKLDLTSQVIEELNK